MKAIVYESFGSSDVLQYREIDKPVPGDEEVLITVRAASVNPLDWKLMKGGPFLLRLLLGLGKRKLKQPGVDVAGEIETVGRNIIDFKPGDKVFGTCAGAFAEYATSKAARGMKCALVFKPENVTFEQAAAAPVAALTALQAVRDHARVRTGQKVLVNGAAGGVGTFAVQIARSFGANVTAVCSTRNMDMVQTIGAHQAIDYTARDFTKNGQQYDVILDCVGNRSIAELRRTLNPGGVVVLIGASKDTGMLRLMARFLGALVLSPFMSRKVRVFIARVNTTDLNIIREFLAAGTVTPVIDRCYRLSEARQAFQYMEQEHARGKVIITSES